MAAAVLVAQSHLHLGAVGRVGVVPCLRLPAPNWRRRLAHVGRENAVKLARLRHRNPGSVA
ncbi:MAG: hypothetical protein ABIR21_12255, partial [Chthoniobacterales bacterium]